ncbi:MAG TPA: FkbM family methyltransferase [Pyrinomonadaceae bacterium]
MSLYSAVKRLVPLRLKVAAHSYFARRRAQPSFAERRATIQLHQPLVAAHPAIGRVGLPHFSLYVLTTGYIGQELSGGSWEPHVTRVVEGLLKEGDTFLDIGANVGYFTMLGSRLVGPSGRVIAVEPNPQNVQLLCANILENDASNVTLFPLAVSDSEAVLKFVDDGSNAGVVNEWTQEQWKRFHFLVPSARLDDLLAGRRVDAVKIDVEAHEPVVLRGMEETIRRHRPTIVTEFHPWSMGIHNREEPADYLRQLRSYGYRLSVITESGELLDTPSEEAVMDYWRSLGAETAHLDLLARPE